MSARAAIALTFANVAAGLLNYLFQVHAAVALDAVAFGALSAWLARVTVASSIASVVQFLSLDFRTESFERFSLPAAGLSVATMIGTVVIAGGTGTVALAAVAVASSVLLYAAVGQLQARLRLGDIGAAVFVVAAVRFALPFATTFYVAQAIAPFAGIVVVGATMRGRRSEPPARAARSGLGARLVRSVLLAIAAVSFPQLDVLVLAWREDATTLGIFSRLVLAARIVFFAGAAVLPVLHAHQLRSAEDASSPPSFVVFGQRWLAPATIASSVVVAGAADFAFLHVRGERATWLYLSCVSAALLVSILAQVQRIAVRGEITRAIACIAGVFIVSAVAVLIGGGVTSYVMAACAGNAVVLTVATVLASRPCRS